MAYPKALNDQYKAEKAAGTTTAKSFNEWHSQQLGQTKAVEKLKQMENPTTAEVVANLNEAIEEVAQAAKELSKAAKALAIYEEEDAKALAANLKLVRKTVIDRFVKELPLSKPGSATYFQNIKKKKGLIATS